MKLFGKKKAAPSPKDSIIKLRDTMEMLEKRENFLQKKVEDQTLQAKKAMQAKNKRGALLCLQRKKTFEGQIQKISGARMTIETQLMAIEGANVSLEAMNAMKTGAQVMKGIHKNMTVDEVDDTMEDIREQMEVANEINEAISQPLGDVIDIDELTSELEELEQESLDEQLLNLNKEEPAAIPTLPNAPTKIHAEKQQEEDELAALEQSMAM